MLDPEVLRVFLDENGRLKEAFAGGELGKEYLQVLEKVQSIQVSAELKACVYNYLLGIDVKKMRTFDKEGRLYRAVLGEKKGKRMAIVWRPVKDMEEDPEKLMGDKVFIEKTVLPALLPEGESFDRLFVNGACFAENAEAIEAEFKRLMFAEVV